MKDLEKNELLEIDGGGYLGLDIIVAAIELYAGFKAGWNDNKR